MPNGVAALTNTDPHHIVPEPSRPADDPLDSCPLTFQHLEIVKLVALGLSNKEVGARMNPRISVFTVKSHLANIKRILKETADPKKINVGDRTGMVVYCISKGWLRPR